MICLMCKQGEPLPGLSKVIFLRGEFKLVVKSVPALVCPVCGESYTDELTATRLLEMARETESSGLQYEETVYRVS